MLNFKEDEKSKLIALHYAHKLDNVFIESLIKNNHSIKNKSEAVLLAQFYWDMLDQSAKDKDENIVVLNEHDVHHWIERLFHLIGGYLTSIGFETEWNKVCDEA